MLLGHSILCMHYSYKDVYEHFCPELHQTMLDAAESVITATTLVRLWPSHVPVTQRLSVML